MSTLFPTLPATGIEPAARVLAQASRVLVLSTTSLQGEASPAACSAADRSVWRQLSQVGQWRSPVRGGERVPSQWARQRLAQAAAHRPGAAHGAVAQLQTLLQQCEIVTDRTDLLLQTAGARPVWHLNGHVPGERCARCGAVRVARAPASNLACTRCGGHRMHDWPGEGAGATPRQAWVHARLRLRTCDALLWLADEDLVYPAAEFAHEAARQGARVVLVSRAPHALARLADVTLQGEPAETLPALAAQVAALRMGRRAA